MISHDGHLNSFALVLACAIDRLSAHGTLALARLQPALDASSVIEVLAGTLQLGHRIVFFESRHTNDALVLLANGTK